MEPGFGLLRVALLAVRTGRDFLTDEVEAAIRTAAVATAEEHAGAYEDYLADHDDVPEDFELPAPLDRDAYEAATDSLAERLVVMLLFHATAKDTVGEELDETTRVDGEPSPDVLAAAMEQVADPDLALDFDAVAADFVDNLERAWAGRSDEGLQLVVRYLQQIHTVLVEERLDEADEKLTEQGFDRLEPSDLQDGLYNSELCWRRSFTFTEVYAGIPIERERPGGERTKVADGLMDELEGGNSVVLLGEPGAGKTTICKNVACRWYDREDTGAVLYRSHKKDAPVTDPDELVDAIRKLTGDGPVLVHVEDAARHDSVGVFEAIRELQGDDDVSFLLNSREQEWERLTDVGGEQGVFDLGEERGQFAQETAGTEVESRQVPDLDEREIERILEKFESETGKSVRADPAELDEQISTEEGASPMLLLSYHLPIGNVGEPEKGMASALHGNVRKAYDRITGCGADAFGAESGTERDLLEEVALLVNVLNAAGIGVYEGLVYALADSGDDHEFVADLFEPLHGVLLFGQREEMHYWSHHEYWSELYLQEHLDKAGEIAARNTFEHCVNAVFGVVESEAVREEIQDRHGMGIERLKEIDENETGEADAFTAKIFHVGVERPNLLELYGDSEHSGLDLPELLSSEFEAGCALWRFRMFRDRGDLETAKDELDEFRERADSAGMERGEALYHNRKGRLEEGKERSRRHGSTSSRVWR